jgi:hypothetical protein
LIFSIHAGLNSGRRATIPGMIVFDTEDNSKELLDAGRSGFEKTVTQIAAICDNGKRFYNAGNPREFLKWCHQMGKHDVWAFNAQYDLGNLCNGDSIKLDDFDVTMVKGRFIQSSFQGIKFYDVRNICGGSVGQLGLAVGLPKFGFKYSAKDFATFTPERQKEYQRFAGLSPAQLFANKSYVFRDCEIPLRWLKFVAEKCAEMGIEKIPATLGGLCTKAFAAGGGMNWHEAHEETLSAIRGARVELFSHGGDGRIAYADINSLYPHCLTMPFPDSMNKLEKLEGYGICKCSVNVPIKTRIAPLPFRDDKGRLLFPVGKFSGVWTIHELLNAEKHGTKISNIEWIFGSKTAKPFYRDFIVETYQKRLAAKSPAENMFYKLLMNNLYGRLAIGGEISRSLLLTAENCNDPDGIPYGRKILAAQKMPLPAFTNYLHAAYVLSYARIILFNYLKSIPADDLIYCDTDSVIFYCQGELPFPVNKDLGAMKLEAWGRRCVPILPKTYIFDDVHKAKGVPKQHAKTFIETKTANYDSPFKLKESIRFYDAKNSRKLSIWRKVKKDLKAVYDKKRNSGEFYLPKQLKGENL